MTEFTQRQWEEWRGRRSLLEEKVKAKGFEVRGWVNGKPIVPKMFPRDLTAIALSINELRAKYSAPPAPVVEIEPEPESQVEQEVEKPKQRRGRPRKKT